MAVITEAVTTTENVDYTTPVYRKNSDDTKFYLIYSATKMLVVDKTEDFENIRNLSYPGGGINAIAETIEATALEFSTAYDETETILAALIPA